MAKRALVLAAITLIACHSKDKVEVCNDFIDNDGDELIDCADDGCVVGTACGPLGAMCTPQALCAVPCTGDGSAEQCGDAVDNDCDGLIDCADADCSSAPACSAPMRACGAVDAAGLAVCLTISRTQLPADGLSSAQVSASLATRGLAVGGATCTFSVSGSPGRVDGATVAPKITDAYGRASVTYTAGDSAGDSRVHVSCAAGQEPPVTASIDVKLTGIGSLRVVSADHDVLGTSGSGYQEHSEITFQLLTADGSPFPAGGVVELSHQSHGGSYIGGSPRCEGNVCTVSALTDAEGKVKTVLTSGREFAVLTVEASARGGGRQARVVAGGYAVVGAKANGAHISLDCRPYNVPAFTEHDCLYSRYDGSDRTLDCTVTLADRFGTVLGVPALAALQSEAGNAGPAAFTVAYDPAKAVSDQPDVGKFIGHISVYGHPLPRDVPPFEGEVSHADVNFGCGPRTVNPRDGLVTVIAIVPGEEGFVDANSNGVYDAGEPFVDLGEPFVDADDDGVWTAGEAFEDVNSNAQYDGPNGKWDANTHIWAQTRVLYSGHPARLVDAGEEFFSRIYLPPYPQRPDLPLPPGATSATPWADLPREVTHPAYGVFFTDDRFNPLVSSTKYAAASAGGNIGVTLVGPYNTVDSLGTSYRQLYCERSAPPHGKCFYGPADSACAQAATGESGACFVVPDVGGCLSGQCPAGAFTVGNDGMLALTCSKPSPDVVSVSAEIEGVSSTLFVNEPFGSERACGDEQDNDCDGTADCADDDCAASVACALPAGSCTTPDAAGRSLCLRSERSRLPSDGSATAAIELYALLHGFGVSQAPCTVSASGTPALLDGQSSSRALVTGVNGSTIVTLKAGTAAGYTTLNASCAVAGATVSTSLPIEQVAVGALRVIAADHQVLGARSSGYQEHSRITFEALAEDGTPMPAGARVEFKHERQGGSYIADESTCAATLCTVVAETDAEGKVRVVLASGRKLAVLTVGGKVVTGSKSAQATAGGYYVVGAKPNGAHISLDCRPYNVPAFTVHDCLYSRYNGAASTVDCAVTLADRYGIVLGVPALAAFQSETGNMGPPAFTTAYDTTKPVAAQPDVGRAVGYMSVYGHPLPRDVDAWSPRGEFSRAGVDFGCGQRNVNPRDGLVSVIAIVAGEEGFVDSNLNGSYDLGEAFIDLGEPFVDANDDGRRDLDEWFEDVNSNFVYDGPNGIWDADTHLWTETRVLYTGNPRLMAPDATPQYFSRIYDDVSAAVPNATPAATEAAMTVGELRHYGVFFTDDRFNPLTPEATYNATTAIGNVSARLVGPTFGDGDVPPDLFRLLYCDSNVAPYGTCRYGPADAACRGASSGTGPKACYVIPDVANCSSGTCTGFAYGNRGSLFVGCEKPGMDVVSVTAGLDKASHSLILDASCAAPAAP